MKIGKLFQNIAGAVKRGFGKISGGGKKILSILPKLPTLPKTPTLPKPDTNDIIIENFKDYIDAMTEDTYIPQHHTFKAGARPTDRGGRAKETSRNWIYDEINKAILQVGKPQVAANIQAHGEELQDMLEDLTFAIYDGSYAKWSGGFGAYSRALVSELHDILTKGE